MAPFQLMGVKARSPLTPDLRGPSMPRRWLPVSLAIALFACSEDGPCATPGAERVRGVCQCPDGTRLAPVAGHSQCLADQSSSDPAAATDSGAVPTRDARPSDSTTDASATAVPAGDSGTVDSDDAAVLDAEVSVIVLPDASSSGSSARDAAVVAHEPIVDSGAACVPTKEVCDGEDNDCDNKADEGLTNVCGGSDCAASLGKMGGACTAGTGDCQGTGTWECDGVASNSLRCTAVERTKNACGTSCGPTPAEDCATPGDDNCNGQSNEGCCTPSQEVCDGKDNNCNLQIDEGGVCPVCGDGLISGTEECDPQARGWNQWSCSPTCQKQTLYRPCSKLQDCSFAKGETCNTAYAICTKTCDALGVSGPGSGCPDSPPGTTPSCVPLSDGWGMCVAEGCANQNACDTGAACVGSGAQSYCFGCDTASVCAAPLKCVYLSGSFGTCQ
jgi:hypothetical protein